MPAEAGPVSVADTALKCLGNAAEYVECRDAEQNPLLGSWGRGGLTHMGHGRKECRVRDECSLFHYVLFGL